MEGQQVRLLMMTQKLGGCRFYQCRHVTSVVHLQHEARRTLLIGMPLYVCEIELFDDVLVCVRSNVHSHV